MLRSCEMRQRLAETLLNRERGIAGETGQRRLRFDDAVARPSEHSPTRPTITIQPRSARGRPTDAVDGERRAVTKKRSSFRLSSSRTSAKRQKPPVFWWLLLLEIQFFAQMAIDLPVHLVLNCIHWCNQRNSPHPEPTRRHAIRRTLFNLFSLLVILVLLLPA